MIIVFISSVITPHQIPLCDELSSLPGVFFYFIESVNIDKSTLPVGWRALTTPKYVIPYKEVLSSYTKYKELINKADAVIFSSRNLNLIDERLVYNKLTFLYSERIYKNWKEYIKFPFHKLKFNKLYGRSEKLYLLSASAFSSKDYNSLGLFRNKSYKWGYFTRVEDIGKRSCQKDILNILWCGRFITWKHPELAVELAKRLKKDGYSFHLNMIGEGDQFCHISNLIDKYKISDVVTLLGGISNEEVYTYMRTHQLFLFTSDQNEGWGAVANEAMSNGCVLVASDKIGSVPYLIKDGENGMIFKNKNIDSLYEKVTYLLKNQNMIIELSNRGIDTINKLWSPNNAALSLCTLISDLLNNVYPTITEGPCSRA